MNYDLLKFHHWLLSSTFKNELFEEKIKLQFVSLLSWLIYPEYREQNSLIKVLKMNKILLYFISTPLILCLTFFIIGRLTADEKRGMSNTLPTQNTKSKIIKIYKNYQMMFFLRLFPKLRLTKYLRVFFLG